MSTPIRRLERNHSPELNIGGLAAFWKQAPVRIP